MKRKLSRLLLAVATVAFASALAAPAMAWAATTVTGEGQLKDALAAGGDVVLDGDIVVNTTIVIPADVAAKLDLNGHNITSTFQTDGSKHIYPLDNYGDLTIEDSAGDGSISGRGVYNRDGAVITVNGAKIIAQDWNGGAGIWSYGTGEVYLNGATVIGSTGVVYSEGYLEINGGTYTCYSGIDDDGIQITAPTYNIRANGGLKITDGTFTSRHGVIYLGGGEALIEDGSFTIEFASATTSNVVYLYGTADLTIKGGEFISDNSKNKADSGAAVLVSGDNAKLTIDSGTFVGMNGMVSGNANIVINGGSFDTVLNYNHYGDIGKFVAKDAVVTVGGVAYVKTDGGLEEAPVAKIGETLYGTLESALEALQSGDTLTLLQNVTFNEKWDCRYNGAKVTASGITINGGGHTITLTGSVDDKNWYTVFRFEDSATVRNLTIDASKATDIQRGISSKLSITVENCTLIGNGTTAKRAIIYGEGADTDIGGVTATVKDCEFINWTYGVSDNQNGQDAKSVSITDSTFENAGVLVSASETAVFTGNAVKGAKVNISSYSDSNELEVTATDNELDSAEENMITAKTIDAQDGFATPVAQVGGKLYASLTEAVREAAGAEDKTVTLLADVTVSGSIDASDVTVQQGDYKIILAADASLNSKTELDVSAESGCYVAVEGNADSCYTYTSKPIPYIPPAEPECGEDAACKHFNDVDAGAWYHEVMDWAVENGILRGYDDGSGNVGPEDATMRTHVAAMLHRLAGEPEAASDPGFKDVAPGAWYYGPVAWAKEAGLLVGYQDGSNLFGAADVITREQMAAALYRYAVLAGFDVSVGEDTNILSYEDFGEVSEWAIPAMQWAVGAGIIGGYTDEAGEPTGYLGPKDDAERAHFAAMLMRMDEAYGIL